MKKFLMLISLVLVFSCEDKDDTVTEVSQMIGLWKMSDAGEYENANCSGAVDNMGFAFMQAFGFTPTIELKSEGRGSYNVSGMGDDVEVPVTWSSTDNEICIGGIECVKYKLSDNKFSFDTLADGYCEDREGNELSNIDESSCKNNPSLSWIDASCSFNEFTKQ